MLGWRLPDATISESKAYVFDDLEGMDRPRITIEDGEDHLDVVDLRVGSAGDGAYRMIPGLWPGLAEQFNRGTAEEETKWEAAGRENVKHALVLIQMPLGAPNRIYMAEVLDGSWPIISDQQ